MRSPAAVPMRTRYMIRRDLLEVLDIEQQSSDRPLCKTDLRTLLRQRNIVGWVAEVPGNGRVVAFMIYRLEKTYLDLLHLAVHPEFRRRGIGRRLIECLFGKLGGNRCRLRAAVPDSQLAMHLFLAAMGFWACGVTRGGFDDRDSYDFVFRAEEARISV